MSDTYEQEAKWANAPGEFATHVATMPRWHKVVVTLGLILMVAGGVGWAIARARQATPAPQPAPAPVAPAPAPRAQPSGGTAGTSSIPAGASGFVGRDTAQRASAPAAADVPSPTPTAVAAPTTTATNPTDDLLSKISPGTMRVGGSVVTGFVVGWLFRAFVKTMMFVALLLGGGLFALSYFGVVNVDLSAIQVNYADAAQWIAAQGEKLKDVVVAHLPSTGAGSLGAYLGFRRR